MGRTTALAITTFVLLISAPLPDIDCHMVIAPSLRIQRKQWMLAKMRTTTFLVSSLHKTLQIFASLTCMIYSCFQNLRLSEGC